MSPGHIYILAILIGITMVVISCNDTDQDHSSSTADSQAQKIVDEAIEKSGGDLYDRSRVAFDFRSRHYVSTRNEGKFTYERIFTDTLGRNVHDILTNEGLKRQIDGEEVKLSTRDSAAYSNSVNSVIYFVLLPHFLNDPAVVKSYLGEETIRNRSYHKISIQFQKEAGGKDHDDEFVYWFDTEDLSLDYLAYNYQTDGGGSRLREAYNIRNINGLTISDYHNLKPVNESFDVASFARMLQNDSMELLSEIKSENVKVEEL